MTFAEVRRRVEEIRDVAADDEMAHSMEDALHQDVLAFVASGQDAMAVLAGEALRTREIDFARWCA